MGGKFKQQKRAARAHNLENGKKTTVAVATGPAEEMYKQGTTKDAVNFDRTNEAMAEYVGVSLGPLASRTDRILTKPVNEILTKPERKYRLVAAVAVWELPVVIRY